MKLKQTLPTTYLLIALILMLILNFTRPVTRLISTPYGIMILFAILMDRMFIQVEERNMEQKYGPVWQAYKKKVRRWF
jgi:protein-S-isoprenylcysteine O-methyltransferase Ste14